MEEIIGVIKLFSGNFIPRGYHKCDGTSLKVVDHQTLYSILGNQYGGDGREHFKLPNIEAPEGTSYIICEFGVYPSRN